MSDFSAAAKAVLEGLDDAATALQADPRLAGYTVTRPHPLIVLVRKGRFTVLVAPGSVWDRGRGILTRFLSRFESGEAMLLLLGEVQDPDLDRVVGHGLAALLEARPGLPALYVAVRNAFSTMDAFGRAESRGRWLNRYRYELGELVEIARMMSTTREIDSLLGLILEKARFITGADAGSIYVVQGEDPVMTRRCLRFKLTQNDSVQFDWREHTIPISQQSIAGATALGKAPINIRDVYELPINAPYSVDRSFDVKINYRTKSMLCAPLIDKAGEVIGVLQLINKKREPSRRLRSQEDFETQVIPFDDRSQELLLALAAQAGISLENTMLYEEIRRIFEGFVHASVEAIESRDPTTSGHSRRVADLSVGLARALESESAGPYRSVRFTDQDVRELEYASLLHDFGKIGVREQVLVKAKKLHEPELQSIRARLKYAMRCFEVESLKSKVAALEHGASRETVEILDAAIDLRRAELESAWKTITLANEPTVLAEGEFTRIDELTRTYYIDEDGQPRQLLRDDEGANLRIPRGSLNVQEIEEIRSHVTHTFRFLERIPWGRSFRRIPLIAGTHHERLNGTGYPNRLQAEEIPLQAKIMSIADIFDALTASDRPYKKAVPVDRAFRILDAEVAEHHIDGDLVRVFREAEIWKRVIPH